ncbi:MAG: hypothetical protein GWN62_23375, partial [Aliifodinibius sp.]|nr:hypothetical protein [Fodinibius sp.]
MGNTNQFDINTRNTKKDDQNGRNGGQNSKQQKAYHVLEPDKLAAKIKKEFKAFFKREEIERAKEAASYYPENTLASDVLQAKYLAPKETGPLHLWYRVARAVSSVEKDQEHWFKEFFKILFDYKFLPGGRIMHGAGREDAKRRPTLSNCYV